MSNCCRIALIAFTVSVLWVSGIEAETPDEDLTQLSLEQLMNIKVVTASKKEERYFKTPTATFVITQEDIRRSGATSIPEVLRMVPGVEVARVDSNKWAITIRGFNGLVTSKLLVLIDGRSVYTGLFAGVFWDTQDTALEDIERIEVVRGPGGAVWGVNAFNGVINIITRKASQTQGSLVSTGIGNVEQGFATVRYGAPLGEIGHYRVYGKWFNRDSFETTVGIDNNDDWSSTRGGFRMDWKTGDSNEWTFQGDVYDNDSGFRNSASSGPGILPTFREYETTARGGNLQAVWTHHFPNQSLLKAQFSYTREDRKNIDWKQRIDLFNLEVQHQFRPWTGHDLLWGVSTRYQIDALDGSFAFSFQPEHDNNYFLSAFVQDTIRLVPDKLSLVLGTKLGPNSYTGFEIQPSARLSWTPNENHTVWGAVSRAVRTPSRLEDSFRLNFLTLPGSPPIVFSVFGNDALRSEDLLAYELGYRTRLSQDLVVDLTAFYNQYDDLLSTAPITVPPGPVTVVGFQFQNLLRGESYGAELAATWQVRKAWRLRAGMNVFQLNQFRKPGSPDTGQIAQDGDSPHFQFNLRSYVDLPYNLEWDTAINFVGGLNNPTNMVDEYLRLDMRLAWKPTDEWEISLVGQNLAEKNHLEFITTGGGSGNAASIPRSVYGKVTWHPK